METMTQGEFDVLYPEAPLRHVAQDVPISEIKIDPHTTASGSLVKSVKRHGVIEPVVLADHGDDGYEIIDGRRRVAAAIEAKRTSIPARVFDADEVSQYSAVLTIALNEERSDNPVSKFDAVVELATLKGVPEDKIARATGLTIPTVKALLALTSVYEPILIAMRKGKVKFSVVRMIAKVGNQSQRKLYHDVFEATGTITARDVRERCPELQQVQDVFPDMWAQQALVVLRELVLSAPPGSDTSAIQSAITSMVASTV
jgi:ParB/RepB/Spo0J family partition protein